MPRKSVWTEGQDSQIRHLRTEGATWDMIAAVLGFTRWTVIERARRLGLAGRLASPSVPLPEADRAPHPAGHPETWGAINRGTCLQEVRFRPPGALR